MPKEQKTITNIYAALSVALLMTFIPLVSAAACALVLFIGTWIAAYMIRGRAGHDSLLANHMTYIIRTLWITGLFSLPTIGIATVYILSTYDPNPLLNCLGYITTTNMGAIQAAIKPCMHDFVQNNIGYFINGTIIAAGPLVIYLVYRLAKGTARAAKGHRIGNVKNWF